jgi:dTMP kinase
MTSFIALEGLDGTGKSTQAPLLADYLGAVLVREPGGTALGERLRQLLIDHHTGDLGPRAEALLFLAARAELTAKVVRPALASGKPVVADRFSGSTFAYQGWGRGLDVGSLRDVNDWATAGLAPDLVVYLTAPNEELARRSAGKARDRMEATDGGFFDRVRTGFEAQLRVDPTWVSVDGSGTVGEVHARIVEVVRGRSRVPIS